MLGKVAAMSFLGLCLIGCAVAEEDIASTQYAMFEGVMELASRQSTVTVFNWNSLLVILGLKLLILAIAGFFGVGLFAGRSMSEDQPWVDQSEVLFMLAYLVSQSQEKYDCLNRVACLEESKAHDLLIASKMMIKGAKYLQPIMGYSLKHYESINNGIEDAMNHGNSGKSCDIRYSCPAMPSL